MITENHPSRALHAKCGFREVGYRERYGHADTDFPVARWISDNAISLPVGPHLDEKDMTVIADSLKEAIAACRH